MSEDNLHIWEIECANPKCIKHFHIITDDSKKPSEGMFCTNCDIEDHKMGVRHVHFKYGDSELTLHTGYTDRAILYRPRTVIKESQ